MLFLSDWNLSVVYSGIWGLIELENLIVLSVSVGFKIVHSFIFYFEIKPLQAIFAFSKLVADYSGE